MKKITRQKFNQFCERVAKLNDAGGVSEQFSVEPSVQQRLETAMQESSEFLKSINVLPVSELEGEKINLRASGRIAGRTDTKKRPRVPVDMSSLDNNKYRAYVTHYDSSISYMKLDTWAKFPNFQKQVRDLMMKQQAQDRITVGWHGIEAAPDTDREKHPMLQDVNIGWLQLYRNHAPQRVMASGKQAGKVTISEDGDYANIDALVMDIVSEMIDPWFQQKTDLVVVCSSTLLHDKYFPIVNVKQAPTETIAADIIVSQKRIGNLPAITVPSFPPGTIMVTSLPNLSIYYQEGSRRRTIRENPVWERVENFESSNDAYVVEDYGYGCVAENIVIADGKKGGEEAA